MLRLTSGQKIAVSFVLWALGGAALAGVTYLGARAFGLPFAPTLFFATLFILCIGVLTA